MDYEVAGKTALYIDTFVGIAAMAWFALWLAARVVNAVIAASGVWPILFAFATDRQGRKEAARKAKQREINLGSGKPKPVVP